MRAGGVRVGCGDDGEAGGRDERDGVAGGEVGAAEAGEDDVRAGDGEADGSAVRDGVEARDAARDDEPGEIGRGAAVRGVCGGVGVGGDKGGADGGRVRGQKEAGRVERSTGGANVAVAVEGRIVTAHTDIEGVAVRVEIAASGVGRTDDGAVVGVAGG